MISLSFSIASATFFLAVSTSTSSTTATEVPTMLSSPQSQPASIVDFNEPICYMRTEEGRVIDLTRLCGGSTNQIPEVAAQPAPVEYEPRDE
jgi:Na+/H+-dicarboxylate symporter